MKNSVKQLLLVVIFSFLIAVVSVTVSSFIFTNKSIKEQSEANDILSIYDKTDYQYIIKNPSYDQIAEFEKNSSINKVIPYYQLVYRFVISGSEVEISLKSIDNQRDQNYTEFSENRLIESKAISGNKIYLDYGLSKIYNLKVGDSIGSNAMQFTIAGFFQNYDAHLAFVPDLKNLIKKDLSYAGVYINVGNEKNFIESVLNGYKPLAILKDRDSFSDENAYQDYLKDFDSRDYSSYIIEKNNGYSEAKDSFKNKTDDAKSAYLTAGIISGIIILMGLISLTLFSLKKIKYEVVDGARKSVIIRYAVGGLTAFLSVIVTWLVVVKCITNSQVHYISLLDVLSLGLTSLIIPVVSVIVALIVNIVIVQGYKEKKEDKKIQR